MRRTKEQRRVALERVRDAIRSTPDAIHGRIDCPMCGGSAQLWWGISSWEDLAVDCGNPDNKCSFSHSWPRGWRDS